MTRLTKLLGVALVATVAFSGLAAAAGGVHLAGTDTTAASAANGTPADTDTAVPPAGDRSLNGTNSPWVTGDDRLERFQERFDLTDRQLNTIRTEVTAAMDAGADRDEIRATVTDLLASYGVSDPVLGPNETGPRGGGHYGQGAGQGYGPSRTESAGGFGDGWQGGSTGPRGPADGSCLS